MLGVILLGVQSLVSGCSNGRRLVETFPHAVYSPSVVCEPGSHSVGSGGTLLIVVTDANGNAIPGANLAVSNELQRSRQLATDDGGRALAQALRAGTYAVSASLDGFRTADVGSVPIRDGCITAIVLPLRIVDIANWSTQ